jgi:heme/copper-type cytochrome/quinol oxidase subunit 2
MSAGDDQVKNQMRYNRYSSTMGPTQMPTQVPTQSPKKENHTSLYIGIGVIVVGVVLAFIYFWPLFKSESNNSKYNFRRF